MEKRRQPKTEPWGSATSRGQMEGAQPVKQTKEWPERLEEKHECVETKEGFRESICCTELKI